MAYTDILNPTPNHPLNPDYGWQRKRPITHVVTKANVGAPFFREMTDVGHAFLLNWGVSGSERELRDVNALKYFYEQYRDGLFTLIDHEGGGRHYVGRFASPVEPVPIGHNRWTVQQVLFEEVPGVPMLIYPNRWEDDNHGHSSAIWRFALSDFGEIKVAVKTPSLWYPTVVTWAKSGTELRSNTSGEWAQMAYVGWGFQLWAPKQNDQGIATIFLDGVNVGTLDFYSASLVNSSSLFQKNDVPLGKHIVQLYVTGTKNSGSSNYFVPFDALRVMR